MEAEKRQNSMQWVKYPSCQEGVLVPTATSTGLKSASVRSTFSSMSAAAVVSLSERMFFDERAIGKLDRSVEDGIADTARGSPVTVFVDEAGSDHAGIDELEIDCRDGFVLRRLAEALRHDLLRVEGHGAELRRVSILSGVRADREPAVARRAARRVRVGMAASFQAPRPVYSRAPKACPRHPAF